MIHLRKTLAGVSLLLLVACAQEQQIDASLASTLSVSSVTAVTSVSREETAVPKAEIVEAARGRVAQTLRAANARGTMPVVVELNITSFYIANPIAGVLLGGSQSNIVAEVKVLDAATGAVVTDSFRVVGATEPRPTILGAAAIKAPKEELSIITSDLARNIAIAVYGNTASGA